MPNLEFPQDQVVRVERLSFRENGAGTYSGVLNLPAGALVMDVIVHAEALWDAATSAELKVGDGTDDDGFFTAVDLKATDLLAAESISFMATGGQHGADVDAPAAVAAIGATTNIDAVPGSFADLAAVQSYLAGANVVPRIESRLDAVEAKADANAAAISTANGQHIRRRRLAAARQIKATITSVGAGTLGRTHVFVVYANPTPRWITR